MNVHLTKRKNIMKTVIITGASNGMGYEAAKVFASKGWKVFAGARRVERFRPIKILSG